MTALTADSGLDTVQQYITNNYTLLTSIRSSIDMRCSFRNACMSSAERALTSFYTVNVHGLT
jgi:hypothetical protein